uniref:Small ribosomal subunit protein eS6 n=1 Tax=Branchiostoma floridae TaxID=7739 RepID=C3YBF5_BRAFL|eukprot:XP_002606302.1 hypothetical protein BRAFLDRAFT_67542 [Branchiostoma floridae]
MKINISYPATGCQKLIEVDDERKLRPFYEKRMSHQMTAESLGDEWKDIPGLTDTTIPRRLGPKRAGRIRKLFNLNKEDDVRQYVVRRPLPQKEARYIHDQAPIGPEKNYGLV